MSVMGEIVELNKTFRAHRIMARVRPVDGKGKQLIILAPSYYIIPVERHSSVKISQVSALLPELRAAVTAARKSPTMVRFSDDLCSSIEIARPDPKVLGMDFDAVSQLPSYSALVAKSYQYGVVQEILSLTDSRQGSTFAAGMSGTGKSTFMRSFLGTLAYSTSPVDLHIYLVDMKHRSLVPFEALPHVVAAAYDEQSAIRVVDAVFDEMLERQREGKPYRTLLVIDELRELKFADSTLLEKVSRIASLGRELGSQLLCATQKPLASELGSIIKSQFAVRVVGTLEDANASQHVTGRSGVGAHLLEGNGSMVMIATGKAPTRIQVYDANDLAVAKLVEGASRRWANVPKPKPMDIQSFESSRASISVATRSGSDASMIEELFDNLYDPKRGLANGAKTKFLQAIVGPDAKLAGGNAARVDKAIQHLIRERSAAQ